MICECCGADKRDVRKREITDKTSAQIHQPNMCDDCEKMIHNPALRDARFYSMIKWRRA